MRIEWVGHACFYIITNAGVRILTDPYEPGAYSGAVGYKKIDYVCDIVSISHAHADHCYIADLKGSPLVIREPKEHLFKGVNIKGIESFHDKCEGRERGKNIIFIFEADGLKIAHLGDLGHNLGLNENLKLYEIDVLFLPVGGVFTINAEEATIIINNLKPRIAIPMHFKTPQLEFDIAGVDLLLKDKSNVQKLNKDNFDIEKEDMPKDTRIFVLNPSH